VALPYHMALIVSCVTPQDLITPPPTILCAWLEEKHGKCNGGVEGCLKRG